MKTPNKLLRQAREERGWTQRDLAKQLHVEEQTVGTWERGTRLTPPEMRFRLLKLFEVTPEQLGFQQTEQSTQEVPQSLQDLPQMKREQMKEVKDKNRMQMIQRVRSRWITGILEHLENGSLITLSLHMEPEAVANPWSEQIENVAHTQLIPAGTTITEVYDTVSGELLILGEPGAGKTTILLVLLRDLVARAEQEEEHPIPLIFNLSSWAEKQETLATWLIEEMNSKFQVPMKLAQQWIEQDQVLLLLDGLDEVAQEARQKCVIAINLYRQLHGLVSVVLCCRSSDYVALSLSKVVLGNAVVLQPLTMDQIDKHLSTNHKQLMIALRTDPLLQETASIPLMLSVLALAYQGMTLDETRTIKSREDLRYHLFERYISRTLQRRSKRQIDKRFNYTEKQVKHYLTWLAGQMQQRNQTEFYIERMQPDWLPEKLRRRYRNLMVLLIYGLANMLSNAMFGWLRGGKTTSGDGVGEGLFGWLGGGRGNSVLGWMAQGLGGGVNAGGTIGLIYGVISVLIGILITKSALGVMLQPQQGRLRPIMGGVVHGIKSGGKIAVIVGLFASLLFGVLGQIIIGKSGIGIQYGTSFGLITGLLVGLVTGVTADLPSISPDKKLARSTRLFDTLVVSLCAGGGFALTNGLLVGWAQGIAYGAVIAVMGALFFGIDERIGSQLIQDLGVKIKPVEFVRWSWESVRTGLVEDGKQGLLTAVSIAIAVATVLGLSGGWFHGWLYGLRYGLIFGPIVGLTVGVARFLTVVLKHGWTGQMLDEHQFDRPDEGIARSLHNGLFAACIFGPIGGIASGLVVGLAFGLVGGLSGWLILGAGFAITLGLQFTLTFWNMYGGSAYVEHLILRIYLWRTGNIPWDYIRFLDYAADHALLRRIGGGYMFIHSLLLEHLASLHNID